MLVASSYTELIKAQIAIENLNEAKPTLYEKFMNIINLTKQFQFGYQFMGSLIMDEDARKFQPKPLNEYVLSVYLREIEKLKSDNKFFELKQLLNTYKKISYSNLSRLALGENPKELVGPTLIR